MKRQIILASKSPRREQLLKLLKIKFKAVDSGYREVSRKDLAHTELVKFLAIGKAKAAAKKYPKAVIIAADTMISFNGKIIGKPKNKTEAEKMLKSFSGRPHNLVTGLAVMDARSGKKIVQFIKSKIYFKKLSRGDITKYVASGEPFGKAGGYNLQGLGFNLVAKIGEDFTNNLGLPMGMVYNALQKLGIVV